MFPSPEEKHDKHAYAHVKIHPYVIHLRGEIDSSHLTDVSSRSHPEQALGLHGDTSVVVRWVDWFDLDGDLVSQQFVEASFGVFAQVWFTVKSQRGGGIRQRGRWTGLLGGPEQKRS